MNKVDKIAELETGITLLDFDIDAELNGVGRVPFAGEKLGQLEAKRLELSQELEALEKSDTLPFDTVQGEDDDDDSTCHVCGEEPGDCECSDQELEEGRVIW